MSNFNEIRTPFVVIEHAQLARLKTIATQLYREERLNGDQMRDMGHAITGVLDSALPFPFEEVMSPYRAIDQAQRRACPIAEATRVRDALAKTARFHPIAHGQIRNSQEIIDALTRCLAELSV